MNQPIKLVYKSATLFTEVGSTAVQKYRVIVTRYFFGTVVGTVGTFSKKFRFRYRRYFFSTFNEVLNTFVWNGIKIIQKNLKLRRSTFKSCSRNKEWVYWMIVDD